MQLKRALSLFDATAISIGAIIGGGIFVVIGIAASQAGSSLILSMLIAAVVALLTALSFVELTCWKSKEGSIYEYTHELISPFAGFLTGWMWLLSNAFSGAAVALGFAYYAGVLFPDLPSLAILGVSIPQSSYVAATVCVIFTSLNYVGAKESALLNNILVVAKVSILSVFVIFGVWFIKPSNYLPFEPFNTGVLYGAFYIFFAFGGFARVAVVAEEIRNPQKNVPRAILLSLFVSTLIYALVAIVAIGVLGTTKLSDSTSPLADAAAATATPSLAYLVAIGGLMATASVLLTSILGVSRMAYAMARNGDLPQRLSRLDRKSLTPLYSVWIVGLIMLILVLFVDLSGVVAVSTFALLFYYAMANISAMKLKLTKRRYPIWLPMVGTVTTLGLLLFVIEVSPTSWTIGLACLLAGTTFYILKKKLSPKNDSSSSKAMIDTNFSID